MAKCTKCCSEQGCHSSHDNSWLIYAEEKRQKRYEKCSRSIPRTREEEEKDQGGITILLRLISYSPLVFSRQNFNDEITNRYRTNLSNANSNQVMFKENRST